MTTTSGDQQHPTAATGAALARRFWVAVESLNAVTYFHPAARDAIERAGAKGFWMGYFACRLAPLGPVGPEVAIAACYGFAPERPYRALPDAWQHLPPERALIARAVGSAAALRQISPAIEDLAPALLGPLERLVEGLDVAGRVLAAGNRQVLLPDDPVERLWQLCTMLREHRGDGHVALLGAAGLDGCESNVLAIAERGHDPEILRTSRAWSPGAWEAATRRLGSRGLIQRGDDGSVRPSPEGTRVLAGIERRTDELAYTSYLASASPEDFAAVAAAMTGAARPVAESGIYPPTNPMGLPAL